MVTVMFLSISLGKVGKAHSISTGFSRQRPRRGLTERGVLGSFPRLLYKKNAVLNTGFKRLAGVTAVILLIATAACETAPPVQEMSDARQAIAVAREAGAAEHAVEELREAESFLESAEQSLNRRYYIDARREALQAKSKAVAARKTAEVARDKQHP